MLNRILILKKNLIEKLTTDNSDLGKKLQSWVVGLLKSQLNIEKTDNFLKDFYKKIDFEEIDTIINWNKNL